MDNNFNQNFQNQQNFGYSQPNNDYANQGFEIPNNNINMYNQYNVPQEQPKKKKTILIVLIILGLLCLCCSGSCVAAMATGNVSFSIGNTSSNSDLLEELKNIEDEDENEDKQDNKKKNNDKKKNKDTSKNSKLKEHSKEIPTITIDGDELTFGITLNELEDMGYTIVTNEYTDFELDDEINDSYFFEPIDLKTPKGNIIGVWIENLGDTPTTPRDCYVVAYDVEYNEYDKDYQPTAKLSNGVILNKTTLDEFEEAYPNPDYEYISDDSTYVSYDYNIRIDDESSVDYHYTFIDDVLVDIEITGSFY